MKLARKIGFTLFVTTFILIIIPTVIFYYFSKEEIEKKIYNQLEATVQSRTNHIDSYLFNLRNQTMHYISEESLISLSLAKKGTSEYDTLFNESQILLNNLTNKIRGSNYIDVVNLDGVVVASSIYADVDKDVSNLQSFKDGKKAYTISDISKGKIHDQFYQYLSAPIVKKNKIVGVILITVSADALFDIVTNRVGLGDTGEIYIVNKDGYMITPSRFRKHSILQLKINTLNFRRCCLHKTGKLLEHKEVLKTLDYRNHSVLGSHDYIPQMQWCVLAEIDEDEAFYSLNKIKLLFIFEVIVIAFVTLIVGVLLSRRLTKPLVALHKGSEMIGSGNLDYKVEIDSKDELEDLGNAFNKMTENLKQSTTTIGSLEEAIQKSRELEEKLKKALDVKSEFVALVSHELKTPLTSIKESICLILDGLAGDVSDEQKDLLQITKRNIDRLTRLVNDILDIQKLDMGKMKYSFKECDINQVIEDVVKTEENVAKDKKIELIANLDKNISPISADRDRLSQVIYNLVNNALKFTENGNITINTKQENDNILISVADSGMGIDKNDLEKLFKSFSQLKQEKSSEDMSSSSTKGTGLGLAISKKIIEAHGGTITVDSVLHKGTTFTITIPLKKQEQKEG
jgi:signal transduction histidine kinase